jgi:membrane protease subunit (stomatin/prohibitin family)
VAEPALFLTRLAAGDDSFTTTEIQDQLRSIIVSRLNDFLGENLTSILDLPGQYREMGEALSIHLGEEFRKFGLELQQFFIQSVTPPEEVQKAIDARSSMGAVGNLDAFLKYKAAHALEGAAAAGGAGGQAMGMMAGIGLGGILPGMLVDARAPSPAPKGQVHCAGCHNPMGDDSRFCPKCGKPAVVTVRCLGCSADLPPDSRFCAKCGKPLAEMAACGKCSAPLVAGAHFCMKCGEKAG